jgi:hypothetical protein
VAAKIMVYLSMPVKDAFIHKSIQLNQYKNNILIHGFCDAMGCTVVPLMFRINVAPSSSCFENDATFFRKIGEGLTLRHSITPKK